MKDLQTYITEAEEQVFAVQDTTGAILNIFPTKQEAEDNARHGQKNLKQKLFQ